MSRPWHPASIIDIPRIRLLPVPRIGRLALTPAFSAPAGPYEVNGVPLRRVNQAYVIATSVVVDISGVSVPEHLNDAYFARPKAVTDKKDEDAFLATDTQVRRMTDGGGVVGG